MDKIVMNVYNSAMSVEETASPPPNILVTGYFKEQHGYAVYRKRGSGNWLITYTLEGQGLYRQPGLQLLAMPGDIILLQPDALHDYSVPSNGSWNFLWAHFQPKPDWFSWWRLPKVGEGLFKVHLSNLQIRERVQHTFFRLHADASMISGLQLELFVNSTERSLQISNMQEPLGMLQRELALNGLEEVLLLAVRENMQTKQRPLDHRVQHILNFITQDFTTQHNLETLAREVYLSPSRLAHLFKDEVGNSITNTILTLRLHKAAQLLEFTTHSISMIAEEVGFNSSYYFSRQFHQRFGMSPKAYRCTTISKQSRANVFLNQTSQ